MSIIKTRSIDNSHNKNKSSNDTTMRTPALLKASLISLCLFVFIIELMFIPTTVNKIWFEHDYNHKLNYNVSYVFSCTDAHEPKNCIAYYWNKTIGYSMSALTGENFFKTINDYCADKHDKIIICSRIPDSYSSLSNNADETTVDDYVRMMNDFNARNAFSDSNKNSQYYYIMQGVRSLSSRNN